MTGFEVPTFFIDSRTLPSMAPTYVRLLRDKIKYKKQRVQQYVVYSHCLPVTPDIRLVTYSTKREPGKFPSHGMGHRSSDTCLTHSWGANETQDGT